MNEKPPIVLPVKPSRRFLFAWAIGATLAALIFALAAGYLFLHPRQHETTELVNETPGQGSATPAGLVESLDDGKDFSRSNSVSILLGEKESGAGLRYVEGQRDGLTTIQTFNGVQCRYLNLTQNRTTLYFYFRIDPSFKQADAKAVAIEIEYFNPKPGVIGIHYDSLDAPDRGNPIYRDAIHPVRMTESGTWQTNTFYTKNAGFGNMQNAGADFRIWAKAPELYVRRVTVTREMQAERL